MDGKALKDCLVTTINITRQVQTETGVPIDAESVVKIAISAFIQMSRSGNGYGYTRPAEKKEAPLTINFGKYKGKIIDELVKIDKSYVRWLSEKSENPRIKAECQRLLEVKPVASAQVTTPKPKAIQK